MPSVPTSDGLVTPAGPNDAVWVPNGFFQNGNDMNINIHTVQMGQLRGKRIIKRKQGLTYKGFAFLMTDGTLKLWQRYQTESASSFMYEVRDFLDDLTVPDVTAMVPELVASRSYDSARYTCRVCNGQLVPLSTDRYFNGRLYRGVATAHANCSEVNAALRTVAYARPPLIGSSNRIDPPVAPRTTAAIAPLARDELGQGQIL